MNCTEKSYTKDEVLAFGKYKNQTISNVIEKNPYYLGWAIENDVLELEDSMQRCVALKAYQDQSDAEESVYRAIYADKDWI